MYALWLISAVELALCWIFWWWPFLFRAPHVQKRSSITIATPTRVGLLLETAAFFVAFFFHIALNAPPALPRMLLSMAFGPIGPVLAWTAVAHLGRQFRINAGLYHDHELVRTGPYGIVRHPIYASLLAMLLSTAFLLTRWPWFAASLALFIAGTEIRVRTEDGLLASRFGPAFDEYSHQAPAYLPGIR